LVLDEFHSENSVLVGIKLVGLIEVLLNRRVSVNYSVIQLGSESNRNIVGS